MAKKNNDEEELKQLEKQLEAELKASGMTEADLSSYGNPQAEDKDSQLKFFREILAMKETWKVGNLKDVEIGQSSLSVRSCLELSQYAEAEGLDLVSQHFMHRGDIVAATSMGRKGFMAQLFVTSIKKEQKLKTDTGEKKPWFGRNKEETE